MTHPLYISDLLNYEEADLFMSSYIMQSKVLDWKMTCKKSIVKAVMKNIFHLIHMCHCDIYVKEKMLQRKFCYQKYESETGIITTEMSTTTNQETGTDRPLKFETQTHKHYHYILTHIGHCLPRSSRNVNNIFTKVVNSGKEQKSKNKQNMHTLVISTSDVWIIYELAWALCILCLPNYSQRSWLHWIPLTRTRP